MLLDSARELKRHLVETVLPPISAAGPAKSFNLPAGPLAAAAGVQPTIALGIAPAGPGDFRIAVRVQQPELVDGKEVDQIRKRARNEVDVRYIGLVTKLAAPWGPQRHRPLRVGTSVGHKDITAGTLGGFVRRRGGGAETFVLSNNHVLANENKGRTGDAILQPGRGDDGADPADAVAELAGMVRLKKTGANTVDAAIARVRDGVAFDPRSVRGLGNLAGVGPGFLDVGAAVAKLGRTTGLTRGTVTAIEMVNLVSMFTLGLLTFDNVTEIEGDGTAPFALPGDSGSLILEAGTRLAGGLLFGGTLTGGSNGKGVAYASPLRAVLDALKIDLVTA